MWFWAKQQEEAEVMATTATALAAQESHIVKSVYSEHLPTQWISGQQNQDNSYYQGCAVMATWAWRWRTSDNDDHGSIKHSEITT